VTDARTKEQLRRPARQRIAERRPVDDPRVNEMWESEAGLSAIAAYVDRLGQRRRGGDL
jgi:hypothetical protein